MSIYIIKYFCILVQKDTILSFFLSFFLSLMLAAQCGLPLLWGIPQSNVFQSKKEDTIVRLHISHVRCSVGLHSMCVVCVVFSMTDGEKHGCKTKNCYTKNNFKVDFDYEVDENDDLSVLKCKVCTTYLGEIRKEARIRNIRGNVLDGILNYTDGVKYIHKGNFDKHVKSGSLHSWAKSTYANAATGSTTEEPQVLLEHNQTTINDAIESSARRNYEKLVRTALHIALKEKPYSDFPHLIDLQKSNGLKFLQGKTHRKTRAELIECLADVLRSDLKEILQNANFYFHSLMGRSLKRRILKRNFYM